MGNGRPVRQSSFTIKNTVWLSCLYLANVSAQGDKITCTIPPVKPDQKSVLTCRFPEDISISKKDFTIHRYTQHSKPEAVVDCWWVRGSLGCFTKPGFTFNKTVGSILKVTVGPVTSSHTGTYACQAAGYGSSLLETCDFRLKPGENNTCSVSKKLSHGFSLTCFFNEDVHESNKTFAVYKHNGENKMSVVSCWWEEGRPQCQVVEGYQYNREVSSYLKLDIPETAGETKAYSCWHEGSENDRVETCFLDADSKETDKNAEEVFTTPLVVGLAVGIPLTVLAVTGIIAALLLSKRWRRTFLSCVRTSNNGNLDVGEGQPMIEDRRDPVTKNFQEFMLAKVKEIYPNMLTGHYFVPPVYFNKTQYTTQSVAGHLVHVPDLSDTNDLRHDLAMQHVLYCLRFLAEQEREEMFVLTQFQYDDFLNSPEPDFAKHRLPIPAGMKENSADKTIGCVDVLIVHRRHGVLVGVVKHVSDEGGGEDKEEKDELVSREMLTAIHQLRRAERLLKHLLSDQTEVPTVRQTVMFPNLSMSVRESADVAQNLRERVKIKATDNPALLCLCANHLSDPRTPWDVDSTVIGSLKNWWRDLMTAPVDGPTMSDGLYQSMIARFCGPATRSALHNQTVRLPKTLGEAAFLTGDLYERLTLPPDMIELIKEERLVLVGPPNTCKTRLMTLAGDAWMRRGHDVYVLCGFSVKRDIVMNDFCKHLSQLSEALSTDDSQRPHVFKIQCNLNVTDEVQKTVEAIMKARKGVFLHLLVDEVDVEGKCFGKFCESLKSRCPGLHLWATSSTNVHVPEGWKLQDFKRPLNCPPAVIRECKAAQVGYCIPDPGSETLRYLPPTDGPPVKYIDHKKGGIAQFHDCTECGKEVGDFLLNYLIARNNKSVPPDDASNARTRDQNPSNALKKQSVLQEKDILVLIESDTNQETFLNGLAEAGIKVFTFKAAEDKDTFAVVNNSACAMLVDDLSRCRTRRKVVVYVESKSGPKESSNKWRGLMSCTSQLILVRHNLE